jgi:hypothetical protein
MRSCLIIIVKSWSVKMRVVDRLTRLFVLMYGEDYIFMEYMRARSQDAKDVDPKAPQQ